MLGGRLALDFVNTTPLNSELSWEGLILFLETVRIVSPERGAQLLALPQSDPQAAEGLLLKSRRLGASMRKTFAAMLRRQKITGEWVEPVNEILRITEGHDELVHGDGTWRIAIDDPLTHPGRARAREEHVIGRLVATGTLTQAQADHYLTWPIASLVARAGQGRSC